MKSEGGGLVRPDSGKGLPTGTACRVAQLLPSPANAQSARFAACTRHRRGDTRVFAQHR